MWVFLISCQITNKFILFKTETYQLIVNTMLEVWGRLALVELNPIICYPNLKLMQWMIQKKNSSTIIHGLCRSFRMILNLINQMIHAFFVLQFIDDQLISAYIIMRQASLFQKNLLYFQNSTPNSQSFISLVVPFFQLQNKLCSLVITFAQHWLEEIIQNQLAGVKIMSYSRLKNSTEKIENKNSKQLQNRAVTPNASAKEILNNIDNDTSKYKKNKEMNAQEKSKLNKINSRPQTGPNKSSMQPPEKKKINQNLLAQIDNVAQPQKRTEQSTLRQNKTANISSQQFEEEKIQTFNEDFAAKKDAREKQSKEKNEIQNKEYQSTGLESQADIRHTFGADVWHEVQSIGEKISSSSKKCSLELDFSSIGCMDDNLKLVIKYFTEKKISNLKKLWLNYGQHEISFSQMELLDNFMNEAELQLNLIVKKFVYEPPRNTKSYHIPKISRIFHCSKTFTHIDLVFNNKKVTSEIFDGLVASLEGMHELIYLKLFFLYASIGNEAINKLAVVLNQMNKIKSLILCFSGGESATNDYSINLISTAIRQMPDLIELDLSFGGAEHKITDAGMEPLSEALANTSKITKLALAFDTYSCQIFKESVGSNGLSDKGLNLISESIKKQKKLKELTIILALGNHNITNSGIKNLAAALNETPKIIDLHLNFSGGKNCISDTGMRYLQEPILKLGQSLKLDLIINGGLNTVTSVARNKLAKGRKKFKIHQILNKKFYDKIKVNKIIPIKIDSHQKPAATTSCFLY